jgi:hypothetical protein
MQAQQVQHGRRSIHARVATFVAGRHVPRSPRLLGLPRDKTKNRNHGATRAGLRNDWHSPRTMSDCDRELVAPSCSHSRCGELPRSDMHELEATTGVPRSLIEAPRACSSWFSGALTGDRGAISVAPPWLRRALARTAQFPVPMSLKVRWFRPRIFSMTTMLIDMAMWHVSNDHVCASRYIQRE